MTRADFDEIIGAALKEVAKGQIVNASGYTGAALESRLRSSFNELITLADATRKFADEKWSKGS